MNRKPYSTDVSDDEWAFVAPYLTLMTEAAPQREHALRDVFNALRYLVRGGISWRMLPNDLPPWNTVYQQTQRWLKAGVFEAIVHDVREGLRVAQGRQAQPSAVILDSRTLQSTRKAAQTPPTTGPNGAKAARPTSRWIPWAICWRWW